MTIGDVPTRTRPPSTGWSSSSRPSRPGWVVDCHARRRRSRRGAPRRRTPHPGPRPRPGRRCRRRGPRRGWPGFGDRAVVEHRRFDHLAEVVQFAIATSARGGEWGAVRPRGQLPATRPRPTVGSRSASDGPLDMRMDRRRRARPPTSSTAPPPSELAETLRRYGDERFARRIAHAIVAARPIAHHRRAGRRRGRRRARAGPPERRPPGPPDVPGHPHRGQRGARDPGRLARPGHRPAARPAVAASRCRTTRVRTASSRTASARPSPAAATARPGLPCVCGAVPEARFVKRGAEKASAGRDRGEPAVRERSPPRHRGHRSRRTQRRVRRDVDDHAPQADGPSFAAGPRAPRSSGGRGATAGTATPRHPGRSATARRRPAGDHRGGSCSCCCSAPCRCRSMLIGGQRQLDRVNGDIADAQVRQDELRRRRASLRSPAQIARDRHRPARHGPRRARARSAGTAGRRAIPRAIRAAPARRPRPSSRGRRPGPGPGFACSDRSVTSTLRPTSATRRVEPSGRSASRAPRRGPDRAARPPRPPRPPRRSGRHRSVAPPRSVVCRRQRWRCCMLVGMLVRLQVVEPERYVARGVNQRLVTTPLRRPARLDPRSQRRRAGHVAAGQGRGGRSRGTSPTPSAEAAALAPVLGLDATAVQAHLEQPDTGFVYVARQLDPEVGDRSPRRCSPIGLRRRLRRRRDQAGRRGRRPRASAVVGRMDPFGERASFGLEKPLDKDLEGHDGKRVARAGRRRRHHRRQRADQRQAPTAGRRRHAHPRPVAAVLGRVRARGSRSPRCRRNGGTVDRRSAVDGRDPGHGQRGVERRHAGAPSKLNLAVRTYEPGSVMKVVTAVGCVRGRTSCSPTPSFTVPDRHQGRPTSRSRRRDATRPRT